MLSYIKNVCACIVAPHPKNRSSGVCHFKKSITIGNSRIITGVDHFGCIINHDMDRHMFMLSKIDPRQYSYLRLNIEICTRSHMKLRIGGRRQPSEKFSLRSEVLLIVNQPLLATLKLIYES